MVVPTDLDDSTVWQLAASAGAESVQPLPGAEALLADRLAASADGPARGTTVAVLGGRGGAGASTLACALARAAVDTGAVLLVDADPYGGGLDLLMGAEDLPGLRWPDLATARGRASPDELRAALPVADGVTLLSWHRGEPVELPPAAMDLVLGAGRRGHDLVVVDLPRSPDAGGHDGAVGRRHGAARRAGRDPVGGGGGPARGRGSPAGSPTCGWSCAARHRPADRPAGRCRARPAAGRLAGPRARAGRRAGARRAARAAPGADRWPGSAPTCSPDLTGAAGRVA